MSLWKSNSSKHRTKRLVLGALLLSSFAIPLSAPKHAQAQMYGTGQTSTNSSAQDSNGNDDVSSMFDGQNNGVDNSDGDTNSLQSYSGGYQSSQQLSGFKADPLASHLVEAPKNKSGSDPITYLADHETYDKTGLVVWTGNVRVWQGDEALRCDKLTLDRPSGLITAHGHVALVQPDGTVLYATELQLAHGFKDGIGHQIYVHMQENAKLAATGMRRTDSDVTELAHTVYSPCEVCEKNHTIPPFWDIAARRATRDTKHETVEFNRAWLRVMGVPVMYFPYLSMTDPTAKRHSGWLMPSISPHSRYLGSSVTLPYYFVINKSSDLLLRGMVATKSGPQITGVYRNYFNFGRIKVLGSLADDTIKSHYVNGFNTDNSKGVQGYLHANGDFNINRFWHAGVDVNLATNADYMRDYRISGYGGDTLASTVYLEGYGQGSYVRLDGQYYQGLNRGVINNSSLPNAYPRLTYDFLGQPDKIGGRLSFHTTDYYLARGNGAVDQRGEAQLQYDRPFTNRWGQKWLITGRLDAMIYHFSGFKNGSNGPMGNHARGEVLPTGAIKMNWPFLRTFDHGRGSHVFEPIVQFIASPSTIGQNQWDNRTPYEDAFAYEFNDTTLFALNRFQGTDRLDSGIRANFAIHQNWTWRGHIVDMLIGESVQAKVHHRMDEQLPVNDGLNGHHLSDPVGRITFSPNRYVDVTARGRFNPWRKKFDYAEGLVNLGVPAFKINGGYIYEPTNPYYYYAGGREGSGMAGLGRAACLARGEMNSAGTCYSAHTNEVSAGFTAKWRAYHLSGFMRRNLETGRFVSTGGEAGYANDCFGLNLIWMKQYTYIGGQRRNNTFLLNFYLKTIGTFGMSESGG